MMQPSKTLLVLSLFAATTVVTACDDSDATEDGDGRDDAFLAGKADGAIAEGSDDARAVLELVNTASFEVLDDSDEVGLDVRAADGIYSRRVGADGVADTGDDVPFESLAQLDAVPWVGPSAFRKLLAYALDNGYGSVNCDGAFVVGDRCYDVGDEDVAEVPTSETIYSFPIRLMKMHHASNGFTVTGSQDLLEWGSWVTRGIRAAQTAGGWSYAASGSNTRIVDAMVAPDGSLEPVQIGSYAGHSRALLSAGTLACNARDIGQVMKAYAAYSPSGETVAAAIISGQTGNSLRVCEDGAWETVRSSFGFDSNIGVRFTAAGDPQVIGVTGHSLLMFERNPQTGWEQTVVHDIQNGTHADTIDVVAGPQGQTYVYAGTRTFTNDPASGDLSVERVVLDDTGVVESVVLFDGEGADRSEARGAHVVQAGIDGAGHEFVLVHRRGSGSQRLLDLIAYEPASGPIRETIDNYTPQPGHGLNVGFAVAPDGTLGLSLQSLGDPLRVRTMVPRN